MNDNAAGSRIIIFIGGLQSHSLETRDDHGLKDDFAPLRETLASTAPGAQFVLFSYGAGPRLALGGDPRGAWANGTFEDEGEPRYEAFETTDCPLAEHVAGLDWLIDKTLAQNPGASLDLIGFSLGGIIALAWAAQASTGTACLRAVHRIVLISSPVGGITPLGLLTPMTGFRHALRRYHIEFGRSLIFRDLRSGSAAVAQLRRAPARVDVASVENSRDWVVNGDRIAGQAMLPVWARTITLGRGVAATSFLPDDQSFVADLGGWERHLRTTHHHIMRGETPEIDRVRRRVGDLVLADGPIWRRRQVHGDRPLAHLHPDVLQQPFERRLSA